MTPGVDNVSIAAKARWQERLLPLMVRLLVGMALFFFAATFGQLFYLHNRIAHAPVLNQADLGCNADSKLNMRPEDRYACEGLRTAAVLEANVVDRRYHQANVAMMSRVWSNYLGFVTGMILAFVGAAFILGRVEGSDTSIDASMLSFKATLLSASPGLALCFLGVVLMIATILTNHRIDTTDQSTYFEPVTQGGVSGKPKGSLIPP